MGGGKEQRREGGLTGIGVEITGRATEDQITLAVALPRFHKRKVPSDGLLHYVVPALGEGGREERREERST